MASPTEISTKLARRGWFGDDYQWDDGLVKKAWFRDEYDWDRLDQKAEVCHD